MIPRTDVTYGQIDVLLRSLGFSKTTIEKRGKGVQYSHKESGAIIALPWFPDEDYVFDYHLAAVRGTLHDFGVADPSVFDAKLKKVG